MRLVDLEGPHDDALRPLVEEQDRERDEEVRAR